MKGSALVLSLVFALGGIAGCSFLAFDDFTTEDPAGADGGSDTGNGGSEGGTSSDASDGGSSTDDAHPADGGVSEGGAGPCPGGATGISPVDVNNVGGITSGAACDVGSAIAVDGLYAGIDRSVAQDIDDTLPGTTTYMSGCLRYDFGTNVTGKLFVRIRTTDNACGTPCSQCLTAEHFRLFLATNPSSPTFIKEYPITRTVSDEEAVVTDKRYAYVCRGPGGSVRDDVQVDGVWICP